MAGRSDTDAGSAQHRRRTYEQACPVSLALDVLGERWTLLVVRDLFGGPLRFTDLRHRLPGLAPNLLSTRLRHLEREGIVERRATPPEGRTAYQLTERGLALRPLVHELARWGLDLLEDPDETPPPRHLLAGALATVLRPERLDAVGWVAVVELPEGELEVRVTPRRARPTGRALERVSVREVAAGPRSGAPDRVHVRVRTSLSVLVALRRGALDRASAERSGRLAVEGTAAAVARWAALAGWDDVEAG